MKEQFRTWKMQDNIKITYEVNKVKRVWNGSQKVLLQSILQTVAAYSRMQIKLTNRQLYYQLVKSNVIPNALEVYKRVCVFLTDCRYSGLIDWDAIEDRGREAERHAQWNNPKDLMDSAAAAYRLPRWSDQSHYIELYCEKEAMSSVFEPIANKYHIHFGANKGYSSAAAMYEMANRFHEKLDEGLSCKLLYFGDHDPSGLDMIRDIRERTTEFLTGGRWPLKLDDVNYNFEVVPLALNMNQITTYDCPPNPAKIADPRADWYFKQYGTESWELDALPPDVLRNIASEGIEQYLEIDLYNAWIKKEDKQKEILLNFAETLTDD